MIKKPILPLLFLFVCLFPGCKKSASPVHPSGRAIKVGVIGPMSGPDSSLGVKTLKGIKLLINIHPYLKNGDKIVLDVADDRNRPEVTVTAFKRMARNKKVRAILLLSSSGPCLAVNAIADRFKTPVLSVLGTHPKIAKGTKYVSQLCFDNTFQGKVAALFVHDELLIDRVAVLYSPNSFHSGSLTAEFAKKFMQIGGEVTDIVPLKKDPNDFKEILTTIRGKDPELLYLPIEPGEIIGIIKTLRALRWHPKCMASDGLLSKVVARHWRDIRLLNGLFAVDFYSNAIILTPYGKKMVKKFRAFYGEKGATFSALGIEGMAILAHAMNQCPDPKTRECINTKIRSTRNFNGIMGKITIKPDGKALRPLIVNRVKDGIITGIVKVY